MEPSGRNRWQPVANGTTPRTAQTGENRCRGSRRVDGKEGVDGSSPSEGLKFACLADVSVVCAGGAIGLRRPPNVHQRPPWTLSGARVVEQADRMFATAAGEVAVVAVDHGQAGAHVAGEVEGGGAGTEREGGEGVSEIVNPAQVSHGPLREFASTPRGCPPPRS